MENDGMIPAGYMYKTVMKRPDWLEADEVEDIYSVGDCMSHYFFCDWVDEWKHNGHWLFNSPDDMKAIAEAKNVDLDDTTLFFYYVYEYQWKEFLREWQSFQPYDDFPTIVSLPDNAELQGYDVVTVWENIPDCAPLACNHLAKEIKVNRHCLLDSFEEAKRLLETGAFDNCEPGPMRIFAVYTVNA